MEQALFILLWVVVGLLVLVMGAALLLWRYHLKSVGMLRGKLESVQDKLDDANEVIKKMKETAHTEDEYVALEEQVRDLAALRDNLNKQVQLAEVQKATLEAQMTGAQTQITSANTHFEELQGQLKGIEEIVKQRCHSVDEEVVKYREGEEAKVRAALEAERTKATEALVKELETLRQELEEKRTQADGLRNEVSELSRLADECRALNFRIAAEHCEALKRLAMDAGTGGQIHLEQADREEVALIRKMCKGLRCENAVLKATYDVYVKPEIERVVKEAGVSGVSGIYRIWKKDGERELSYIGQAVDVGERWKTHAKRAWGVDNTGRIVLYQAMMSSGIEEWYWELVEECDVAVLSEREKYWGEFYAVKELGLNKKLG